MNNRAGGLVSQDFCSLCLHVGPRMTRTHFDGRPEDAKFLQHYEIKPAELHKVPGAKVQSFFRYNDRRISEVIRAERGLALPAIVTLRSSICRRQLRARLDPRGMSRRSSGVYVGS